MLGSMKPFHEQPVDVIDWGIDVNLRGAIYFTRACLPTMVSQGRGVVCCVGSVNGYFGDAMGPMYGVAKSGLFNFVKSVALDLELHAAERLVGKVVGDEHDVRTVRIAEGGIERTRRVVLRPAGLPPAERRVQHRRPALDERTDFFSLKLRYRGEELVESKFE